jgi:HEPN domain-containing protein
MISQCLLGDPIEPLESRKPPPLSHKISDAGLSQELLQKSLKISLSNTAKRENMISHLDPLIQTLSYHSLKEHIIEEILKELYLASRSIIYLLERSSESIEIDA